jgi:DNA phosphorothioation-dependent restriction protein DptH
MTLCGVAFWTSRREAKYLIGPTLSRKRSTPSSLKWTLHVPKKLTPNQRDKVRSLLERGQPHDVVAEAVGVTKGQVAAVAAHMTMRTYGADKRLSPPRAKARTEATVPRKGGAVFIGEELDTNEPVYWMPAPEHGTANPHLLIVGESGSGKTYATQCLCAELVQQRVPVVVFDFGQGFTLDAAPPAFKKFANPFELDAGREGININPLQVFPSDIHGPLNVAQRVADTFARVYPTIGVQQHAVLRDSLLEAFRDAGIEPEVKRTWRGAPPRFSDLKRALEEAASSADPSLRRYASSVASHISTVFVFNTFRANGLAIDWQTIVDSPPRTYVIQLKGLEHLLERVVTELLLWNLIGFLEGLGPGPLRCVVVLDEAHRLSFASNSPVEKLLREGRKFGVGVVLASQQPEDFSSVAFANTATKLVFNITDERGSVARQIVKKASSDTDVLKLLKKASNLPRGTACMIGNSRASIVRVASFDQRTAAWSVPKGTHNAIR